MATYVLLMNFTDEGIPVYRVTKPPRPDRGTH
jgi:uncharacterized protein with GYD domain